MPFPEEMPNLLKIFSEFGCAERNALGDMTLKPVDVIFGLCPKHRLWVTHLEGKWLSQNVKAIISTRPFGFLLWGQLDSREKCISTL